MTGEQLAAELGLTRALIQRYKSRGMPTDSPLGAQAWMREHVRKRTPPAPKPPDAPPAAASIVPANGYHDARVSREQAEARLAQLRALEAEGVLVNRERVRREVAQKLAGLRDSLLQIPSRLQSVLAAESDEGKCHDLVQDELLQALQQFIDEVV